jgi:hypothetical protein
VTAEPERERWHIRKEFSMGTILVLVVYGVSAMLFMARMDERVKTIENTISALPQERIAVAETNIAANKEAIQHLELRTGRSLDEIKALLQRVERKLDERTPR